MTTAILHTTEGDIAINLFDELTPLMVLHFVGLANGTKEYFNASADGTLTGPYYDGSIFSQVYRGILIQGGDITGDNKGDAGIIFDNEGHPNTPELSHDRPWRVCWANKGPNTNSSQFTITMIPMPHLNGINPVFGEIADPLAKMTVTKISEMNRDMMARPVPTVTIESITVL